MILRSLAKLPLSVRLMVAVAVVFLAMFLALGFLATQALDQSSRQILHERERTARLAAYQVDEFLALAFSELETAATLAPFDPAGRDFSAERLVLAQLYQRVGYFALGVSFLDSKGRIVLTEPFRAGSVGVDLSDRVHIQQVLQSGRRAVSWPHKDLGLGKPVVALVVPVKDYTGRLTGVLAGLIDLEESPFSRVLEAAAGQIEEAYAALSTTEASEFVAQTFSHLQVAAVSAPFDLGAADPSREQRALAQAHQRIGSVSLGVSFLDSRGRTVMKEPFHAESIGRDLSDAKHVREALTTRRRTISAPHPEIRTGRMVVGLALPVQGSSGQVKGLIVGLVDIEDSPLAGARASASRQASTAHGDLAAADGTVVASTDPKHLLKPSEHQELYVRVHAGGVPTIETVREIEEGAEESNHVMAAVPLANAPWILGLGADEAETFASVNAFRRTLMIAGAMFGLLALSLTVVGARLLVRPVLRLTQAAERMAAGDLTQQIRVQEGGEIGLLAASLEVMRQRLAASISEITQLNSTLEERVWARTTELGGRNRELAATAGIAAAVSASLDLEEILKGGLDGVLGVVKADAGAIWLRDPVTGDLRLRVHRNLPPEFLEAEQELACGECLCGMVAESGQPMLVRDLAQNPLAVREACRHAGLSHLALVPLASKGLVRGVFMLGARESGFDEFGMRLVVAVAHHLSMAVENARLYEEIQRKENQMRHLLERVIGAQEEERKRIARELHDETGQALSASIMTLEGMAVSLPRSRGKLREQVDQAEGMLRASLDELRKIILDLRPSALDDLGLVAALRRYAEAHLGPLGITPEIKAIGYQEGLWPETEIVLFRIAQEAINNVARHAQASQVRIEVRRQQNRVELDVEDDGKGFDGKEIERSGDPMRGLGLMGMRERAALFGGSCDIISRPGQGTLVCASVPLMEKEVAHHG